MTDSTETAPTAVELKIFEWSRTLQAICRDSFGPSDAVELFKLLAAERGLGEVTPRPTVFVLDVTRVAQFDTTDLGEPLRQVFTRVADVIGPDVIVVSQNDAFVSFFRATLLGRLTMNLHIVSSRDKISPLAFQITSKQDTAELPALIVATKDP